MFIGRKKELASLERLYKEQGVHMTVLYGRRRIGKSTLLSKFIEDKKAIYYTAAKVGRERNLELFSRQVTEALAPSFTEVSFGTLEALFDFITAKLSEEKMILVIELATESNGEPCISLTETMNFPDCG